jgi:hypothetical protein
VDVMFRSVIMCLSLSLKIEGRFGLDLDWQVSANSPTPSAQLRSSVDFSPTPAGAG